MKYEVRMKARFTWTSKNTDSWKTQSTLIEYVDAISLAEAYNEAEVVKKNVATKIMGEHKNLYKLTITIDAVVAMPELLDTKKLTYGDLGQLTLKNNKGQITVCLYILPDGTLADDSWIHHRGWGSKE